MDNTIILSFAYRIVQAFANVPIDISPDPPIGSSASHLYFKTLLSHWTSLPYSPRAIPPHDSMPITFREDTSGQDFDKPGITPACRNRPLSAAARTPHAFSDSGCGSPYRGEVVRGARPSKPSRK